MRREVYIQRKDDEFIDRLCNRAFPSHTKREVCLAPTDRVVLGGMYWDEGSRSSYVAINLDTMEVCDLAKYAPSLRNPPQFGGPAEPPSLPLRDANEPLVVIEELISCGKTMPLRIMASPARLTKFLPKQEETTEDEATVLEVTASLISSARMDELRHKGLSMARIDAAKASLIEKGLLNKRGAITTAGKNVL